MAKAKDKGGVQTVTEANRVHRLNRELKRLNTRRAGLLMQLAPINSKIDSKYRELSRITG